MDTGLLPLNPPFSVRLLPGAFRPPTACSEGPLICCLGLQRPRAAQTQREGSISCGKHPRNQIRPLIWEMGPTVFTEVLPKVDPNSPCTCLARSRALFLALPALLLPGKLDSQAEKEPSSKNENKIFAQPQRSPSLRTVSAPSHHRNTQGIGAFIPK